MPTKFQLHSHMLSPCGLGTGYFRDQYKVKKLRSSPFKNETQATIGQ